MTVAIAPPLTFEVPSSTPTGLKGRQVQIEDRLRLAAVRQRSHDITLCTREGDIVTLSMDHSTVSVYGRDGRLSLNQHALTETGGDPIFFEGLAAETREWSGFATSREFTLSIEGDLSREEVRDIRKALQRIHRLMGRTFGDASGEAVPRAGLAGLDSLAGAEVRVQEVRTVLAARSTGFTALTYGTDGHITPVSEESSPPEAPDWPTAAEETIGIVAATGIAPQAFVDPLGHLFNRWAGEMHRHRRAFEPMVGMMAKTVLDRLRTTSPNDDDARKAPGSQSPEDW